MMDTAIYASLAIAYLALLVPGMLLADRYGWMNVDNVLLIVIIALLYDNGILAWGKYVGEGALLMGLNEARYWLHAFITPLLVPFAWRTLVRAQWSWFNDHRIRWFVISLTIALIGIELGTEVRGITLEANWDHGVLSYKKSGDADGPPIMIIGVSLVLFVTSIMVWWKQRWPWYLIGVMSLGITPILRVVIQSNALHNISELLLMLALLATKAYQDIRIGSKTLPIRS